MPSRWIEAYFTFLEKKADFDLRVTVGDKKNSFLSLNEAITGHKKSKVH